jgi:hypothetical protein
VTQSAPPHRQTLLAYARRWAIGQKPLRTKPKKTVVPPNRLRVHASLKNRGSKQNGEGVFASVPCVGSSEMEAQAAAALVL